METAFDRLSDTQTDKLKSWIQTECEGHHTNGESTAFQVDISQSSGDHQHNKNDYSNQFASVQGGLQGFIRHIMRHTAVL